jgi:NADPH-dependent 2,4-dienoyl-CoA reductase/sulfur reductase-like enzyme
VEVCVVERDPTPMSRIVPAEIGAWHRRLHERRGVAFHVGVTPTAIRQQGDQVVLDLSDATRIEADVVAVGIGVTPNVELLAECGMDLADGVLVDASGRSCDPGIFAVGDVSRPFRPLLGRAVRLESWRNAENQPKAAAATLLGAPTLHDDVPWMWSDQYGINLQVAGSPFDADFVVTRPADVEDRRTVLYLKRGVVVGGVTIDQGRDMRSIQQLIARRAVIDPVRLADRGLPLAVLAR